MNINSRHFIRCNDFIKNIERYRIRQLILLIIDICIVSVSVLIALGVTSVLDNKLNLLSLISIYAVFNVVSVAICRGYSSLWSNTGDIEIILMAVSSVIYVIPIKLINNLMKLNISNEFYIVCTLLILCLTCISRISYRVFRRLSLYFNIRKESTYSRVLIVGAGNAGALVINELYENVHLRKIPVGIIDDDSNKLGKRIHNVKVLGTCNDINEVVKEQNIDEIIMSISKIPNQRKKEIINICKQTKCNLKTIPGIHEIIDGKVDIKRIRDVNIEDLLGREEINLDNSLISKYIENKTILVTGGGGSIGSEICTQISMYRPKKLILLDIYENGAYEVQQKLNRIYGENLNLDVIIGSVRDEKRLDCIFKEYKPNVVFHAAAHKHVPLMEDSPCEAIKNNVFGTRNVATYSHKYNVEKFILISTDKAVNPTNIMGATKRCAEMIIQSLNRCSDTEFVAVRFGNVLGSNGSVVPLFKKQIEEGGPVSVTHPDITRFFMTIPEAVSLVLQAGAMAIGGEIFVLDMGESVKILDLAKNLISLSGFEPGVDIRIEFTGLRPGEKLYEELLMEEEGLKQTTHNKIFIGRPINIDEVSMNSYLNKLKTVINNEDKDLVVEIMKKIVVTFISSGCEDKDNETAMTL